MICPSCTFDNPEGVNFCGSCGSKFPKICPSCGFNNPGEFKFCGNCGTRITDLISKPLPLENPNTIPEISQVAERRHLTVMFCDIVGSTELSNQLDPEDLRNIITTYQKACQTVIAQYDGHIAQYLGDGLLVYFGYPTAHENDAHRAVSSGLGILGAIEQINQQLNASHQVQLSIRVGIHTGLVVVGDIGDSMDSKKLALGATPNIAARLESVAESNTVIISTETYHLVKSFFECTSRGKHQLKGIPDPIEAYQVIHEKTAKIRIEQDLKRDLLPMEGRNQEMEELLDYWEEAKQGHSKVVLLSAEAGMGKSRILQDFASRLSDEQDLWVMPHKCSPYHRQTAYYPFFNALQHLALKLSGRESNSEQLNRLEAFFIKKDVNLEEAVPLFAGLLGLSLEDTDYRPSAFSVDQQKRKISDIFIQVILNNADNYNLLLVFEDLHWMDASSLEIINQLLTLSPDQTILTILSYRPDFEPRWKTQSHLVNISLSSLPETAVRAIINEIANGKSLPNELVDQIIKKTDGIPLFIEELTKMVLNSELVIEQENSYKLSGPISSLAIPSTLHDSLVARLDRLSKTKVVAQIGAVIGRDFDYSLIREVSNQEESQLRTNLENLVAAELLHQSGMPPRATYTFRHALIRDAAYQSLLRSNQRWWHHQIGKVLEKKFQEIAQDNPEILAYHFEKGNEPNRAIKYWTQAGELLRKRQAYDESMVYLERAKGLISKIESASEAGKLELKILEIQAPIYLMTAGWGSPLTFKASSRLEELASLYEDKLNLFKSLLISTTYELFSGDNTHALEKGQKALVIAEELNRRDFMAEAYRILGQTLLFDGSLERGKDSFVKSISLGNPGELVGNEFTGSDPINISQMQYSHVLWLLGFPEQAAEMARQGVENAMKRKLPYDQSICLFVSSFIYYWIGDYEQCHKHALECNRLSKEFGNNMFIHESITFIGAHKVRHGETKEGLDMIYNSLSDRQHRAKKGVNLHSACFAELCLEIGEFEKGLEIVDKAITFSQEQNDYHFTSEVYRTRGDLLVSKNIEDNKAEIEQCYQKSLAISRDQGAKSLELRTAMSIAKLKKLQGNPTEGLVALQPIYDWFTEGHQTIDLCTAKEIIEELVAETTST